MIESLQNLFTGELTGPIGSLDVVLSLLVSFCIGHIVAWIYMWTHEGLSYSRMFTTSLLALPVIVSLVMILMAGSIIIAFGLLAVFTVVRFRNVLKDTRDTTYILWAIIEGMACGTMRFKLAALGCLFIALVFLYLRFTAFGGRHQYDVVLNVEARGNGTALEDLQPILRRHSLRARLASRRELDDDRQDLSFRLMLRDPSRTRELLADLEQAAGVDRVSLYRRNDESEV